MINTGDAISVQNSCAQCFSYSSTNVLRNLTSYRRVVSGDAADDDYVGEHEMKSEY